MKYTVTIREITDNPDYKPNSNRFDMSGPPATFERDVRVMDFTPEEMERFRLALLESFKPQ